jgi:Cu(I)/Ag(I) efflux system membrane fusion protein
MTTRNLILGVIIICAIAIGAGGGYLLATRNKETDSHAPVTEQKQTATPPPQEKKILYWYDPMQPQQHFDQPGKSPTMDMDLVPRYAEDVDTGNTVRIDPALTQNLGMRLATVTRGTYAAEINAVGTLTWNERDVAIIQTRTSGYVERVYARAPNDVIAAGAPLTDILVPEWTAAQTEFLALVKTGETTLIDAARERLRLLGMSTGQIARVEESGKPQAIYTITTPIGGVIQSLDVRAGMTVMAGQTLARVNGLSTVWLDVAVPEVQGGLVRIGDQTETHFTAFPGETFTGHVIALLPETNTESRTLRVRNELDNASGRFRPGMYAEVKLRAAEQQSVLQLPSEAIIRTGQRALVILAEDAGRYSPVEVEIGRETDGQTIILKGLTEGQRVVASGQFLIDSEASLKGISIRPIEETK